MMGLRNVKMFLSLGILYFLLDNGLGAPSRGRYMWLKCNPNGQDPNCVKQRGPLMDISGLPDRLPASAVKDLMNKNSALEVEEPKEGAEEQRMEEPEEEEAEQEVYEDDPEEEEEEEEVYEDDPEEEKEEGEEEEVYEDGPEEEKEEVYEDDPEEGEEEGEKEELYEDDPEEEEEEQKEEEPMVEPVEEHSGEGSAAGPFLNDQGSGEQWVDYSSYAFPEKVMPPVHEMKEEHLIL